MQKGTLLSMKSEDNKKKLQTFVICEEPIKSIKDRIRVRLRDKIWERKTSIWFELDGMLVNGHAGEKNAKTLWDR